MTQYSITFDVISADEKDEWYDFIQEGMYLFVENIGFFKMNEPRESLDGIKKIKSIEAFGCEVELEDRLCNLKFNMGTSDSQEMLSEFKYDSGKVHNEYDVTNVLTGIPFDWVVMYNTFYEQLLLLKIFLYRVFDNAYINHDLYIYPGKGTSNGYGYYDDKLFEYMIKIVNLIPRLKNIEAVNKDDERTYIPVIILEKDDNDEVSRIKINNNNNLFLPEKDHYNETSYGSHLTSLIDFYKRNRTELSLLPKVLGNIDGNWTLGKIDGIGDVKELENLFENLSDDKLYELYDNGKLNFDLANSKFQFEIDESVYSFFTQTLTKSLSSVENLESIVEFDRYNRKINLTKISSLGNDTGVILDYENVLNSLNISPANDTISTRFHVKGGNDLGIEQVNFGKDYIDDLYYKMKARTSSGKLIYVSEELSEKYDKYLEDIEQKRQEYIKASKDYNQILDEINQITYRVPNDILNTDFSTFNMDELKEAKIKYTNLKLAVELAYKGEYDVSEVTEDGIKESAYYCDWKTYDSAIKEIEFAIKVFPYYSDSSKWSTSASEYMLIKGWETNWDLYGIAELENKKAAYEQTMGTLQDSEFIIPITSLISQWGAKIHDEALYKTYWSEILDSVNSIRLRFDYNFDLNYETLKTPEIKLSKGKYTLAFDYDMFQRPFSTDDSVYNRTYMTVGIMSHNGNEEISLGSVNCGGTDSISGKTGAVNLSFEISKESEVYLSFDCLNNEYFWKTTEGGSLYPTEKYRIDIKNFRIYSGNVDNYYDILEVDSYSSVKQNTIIQYFYTLMDYKNVLSKLIELNKKKSDLEKRRDAAMAKRKTLSDSVELSAWKDDSGVGFTEGEQSVLKCFIKESDFVDESIELTSLDSTSDKIDKMVELLKSSQNKLSAYSRPQLSFEVDCDNFMCLPEYEKISENLACGNFITVQYRDGTYIRLRIMQYEVNPRNPYSDNFKLSFSNFVISRNSLSDLESILGFSLSSSPSRRSVGGGEYGTLDSVDAIISNSLISKLLNSQSIKRELPNMMSYNGVSANEVSLNRIKDGFRVYDSSDNGTILYVDKSGINIVGGSRSVFVDGVNIAEADHELSESSTRPVQNKVLKSALDGLQNGLNGKQNTLPHSVVYSDGIDSFDTAPHAVYFGWTGTNKSDSEKLKLRAQVDDKDMGYVVTTGENNQAKLQMEKIVGLETALSEKAPLSHTHTIGNITDLQTALNGKAASGHKHSTDDITSGVLPIERGGTGENTPNKALRKLGIQRRTVELTSAAQGTPSITSVTFSTPFETGTIPTVVITPIRKNSANNLTKLHVWIENITNTGFDIVFQQDQTTSYSIKCNWIACGTPS